MKYSKQFSVISETKVFPVHNPWVYVNVPKKYTKDTSHLADRGLVAISATIGKSSWKSSLMSMGDGTQFIPLSARIRKAQDIEIGQRIKLSFVLRNR